MLVRLLGAVLLLGLLWWWLRRVVSRSAADASTLGPSSTSIEKPEIVACDHCGVHLPRQDLLLGRNGGLFCCETHRAVQEGRR
jgi:uncharacterized protein